MYVYVIAASDAGPSKVGIAAQPAKRLRQLQTASAEPLRIYFNEPIGAHAEAVEKAVHRALSDKRARGGSEWFEVSPGQAHDVIRAAAASVDALIDEAATLNMLEHRATMQWLAELDRKEQARAEAAGDDYLAEDEELPKRPTTLELVARTLRGPFTRRFTFNDYVFTWEDGMWLRWSFERMGRRMPNGKTLSPYLEAAEWFERHCGVDTPWCRPVHRWIEWAGARELTAGEARCLVQIWDKFAPLHNLVECKGPQHASHGIDDHVDDVYLFVLSGDSGRGDRDRVVFYHDQFRAVLIPERPLTLHHIDWTTYLRVHPLDGMPASGFIAPVLTDEVWAKPFKPWLRDAATFRDAALTKFLENPNKRYPAPRRYDGPQPATRTWQHLPEIAEDGTY